MNNHHKKYYLNNNINKKNINKFFNSIYIQKKYKCNKYILDNIKNNLDLIKNDTQIGWIIRKFICENKFFFMEYSFDNLKINFTSRDVIHINDKLNNIFSIHSADNLAIYLYINPKYKEMFGFDRNFMIGKCFYSFLHEKDAKMISEKHDMILSKNGLFLATYRLVKKTNSQDIKYVKISSCIKKIDNIIVTYLKYPTKNTVVNILHEKTNIPTEQKQFYDGGKSKNIFNIYNIKSK